MRIINYLTMLLPLIIRNNNATTAITSKIWMSAPVLYTKKPKAQRTISTTAIK